MGLFQHPPTPFISPLLALKRSTVPQSLLLHSMQLPSLENCFTLFCSIFITQLLDPSTSAGKASYFFSLITMPSSWHCLKTSQKPIREYPRLCSLERHSAEKWCCLCASPRIPPAQRMVTLTRARPKAWIPQLEFQRTDIPSGEGRCQAAVTKRKTPASEWLHWNKRKMGEPRKCWIELGASQTEWEIPAPALLLRQRGCWWLKPQHG